MALISAGTSLAAGLALSRLSRHELWPQYISLGGTHSPDDLLDYLTDQVDWAAGEHDAAAHALNESCRELGFGFPVLYADET